MSMKNKNCGEMYNTRRRAVDIVSENKAKTVDVV
jgi:hypothetical protein